MTHLRRGLWKGLGKSCLASHKPNHIGPALVDMHTHMLKKSERAETMLRDMIAVLSEGNTASLSSAYRAEDIFHIVCGKDIRPVEKSAALGSPTPTSW